MLPSAHQLMCHHCGATQDPAIPAVTCTSRRSCSWSCVPSRYRPLRSTRRPLQGGWNPADFYLTVINVVRSSMGTGGQDTGGVPSSDDAREGSRGSSRDIDAAPGERRLRVEGAAASGGAEEKTDGSAAEDVHLQEVS